MAMIISQSLVPNATVPVFTIATITDVAIPATHTESTITLNPPGTPPTNFVTDVPDLGDMVNGVPTISGGATGTMPTTLVTTTVPVHGPGPNSTAITASTTSPITTSPANIVLADSPDHGSHIEKRNIFDFIYCFAKHWNNANNRMPFLCVSDRVCKRRAKSEKKGKEYYDKCMELKPTARKH